MQSPTSHQELMVYSREKRFPKIKQKESCTKQSFWVETLVLVWFLVEVVLLDGVVALGYKDLVLLKALVPLTY